MIIEIKIVFLFFLIIDIEKSAGKYQGSGKQYESGYAITGVMNPRAA